MIVLKISIESDHLLRLLASIETSQEVESVLQSQAAAVLDDLEKEVRCPYLVSMLSKLYASQLYFEPMIVLAGKGIL